MKVSVVICTYAMERYDVFSACVESVLEQTYNPIEIVIVVDGNEPVYERTRNDFGGENGVTVYCNDENRGISYSRTRGAELASGEIVAFIDDDAAAKPNWIEELTTVYEETDAIAVGGYIAPNWVGEKPAFFPEEFYWLVGCTEPGFATDGEEIRNGYGSNISFRRDVFLAVGGYDENTGRKGDAHIQAHEAPVCIRIRERYGKGVIYAEDAVVDHTLFDYRGNFRWLLFRSFWQGYSKRIMDVILPETQGDERQYLRQLAFRFVPHRVKSLVRSPSVPAVLQLATIAVFTGAVGMGYLYGHTKSEQQLLRAVEDPATE